MRDVIETVRRWRSDGDDVVLARVVRVEGSAPRGPGAVMAVRRDGRIAGSISGGCIEAAVVDAAQAIFDTGTVRLISFGYTDDEGMAVGLTCGGTIEVFLALADW